jgi:hypothetical protein
VFRQFPDQRAVLIGDVRDFERRPGKFQNAPLDDAERTPRKLNQFDHVKIERFANHQTLELPPRIYKRKPRGIETSHGEFTKPSKSLWCKQFPSENARISHETENLEHMV